MIGFCRWLHLTDTDVNRDTERQRSTTSVQSPRDCRRGHARPPALCRALREPPWKTPDGVASERRLPLPCAKDADALPEGLVVLGGDKVWKRRRG